MKNILFLFIVLCLVSCSKTPGEPILVDYTDVNNLKGTTWVASTDSILPGHYFVLYFERVNFVNVHTTMDINKLEYNPNEIGLYNDSFDFYVAGKTLVLSQGTGTLLTLTVNNERKTITMLRTMDYDKVVSIVFNKQ